MNTSSSKSPYLLQVERSNRPKATFGNRFRVAIDEEEAKQTTETAEEEEATREYKEEDPNESYALPPEEEPREEYCDNIKDAESDYFLEKYGEKFNDSDLSKRLDELDKTKDGVDPLQAMEEMTGKISATKPSYTVTDEEAEYFREKYGEKYDENKAGDLYYELSGKGIISMDDACNASGFLEVIPLGAVKTVVYFGNYLPGRENMRPLGSFSALTNDVVRIKDVSRTDVNSPYKALWESFKKTGSHVKDTWEDFLQENIDFERYVKENRNTSDYLFQSHCDKVIGGLERTMDVITRIFGEVTL